MRIFTPFPDTISLEGCSTKDIIFKVSLKNVKNTNRTTLPLFQVEVSDEWYLHAGVTKNVLADSSANNGMTCLMSCYDPFLGTMQCRPFLFNTLYNRVHFQKMTPNICPHPYGMNPLVNEVLPNTGVDIDVSLLISINSLMECGSTFA